MRKLYQKLLQQSDLTMTITMVMAVIYSSLIIIMHPSTAGSALVFISAMIGNCFIPVLVSSQPLKLIVNVSMIGSIANILVILIYIL